MLIACMLSLLTFIALTLSLSLSLPRMLHDNRTKKKFKKGALTPLSVETGHAHCLHAFILSLLSFVAFTLSLSFSFSPKNAACKTTDATDK